MGLCQSMMTADMREQYKVNRKIEKELDKKSPYLEQKILLLGPGESGKSTVLKQMRLMHHIGYSNHELMEKKYLVYLNIMQGMKALLEFADEMSIRLNDDLLERSSQVLAHIRKHGVDIVELDPSLVKNLSTLWASEPMKIAYQNRSRFHLTESTEYFYENLDRIADKDYVPTITDILHTRVPTTGVVRVEFHMKSIQFNVFDVGGQRSERKKWIHCFDDVNALLFVVAVSEFDQKVAEDNVTNRVDEACLLFYEVVNLKYFKKTSLILFLNKMDLFKKKIATSPIITHFPKFTMENNYENGMTFFRNRFESAILNKSKKPYVHETCAVSDTVQIVINSVIDTIVQENLKDTGMI